VTFAVPRSVTLHLGRNGSGGQCALALPRRRSSVVPAGLALPAPARTGLGPRLCARVMPERLRFAPRRTGEPLRNPRRSGVNRGRRLNRNSRCPTNGGMSSVCLATGPWRRDGGPGRFGRPRDNVRGRRGPARRGSRRQRGSLERCSHGTRRLADRWYEWNRPPLDAGPRKDEQRQPDRGRRRESGKRGLGDMCEGRRHGPDASVRAARERRALHSKHSAETAPSPPFEEILD
jgi:hypothetical protein